MLPEFVVDRNESAWLFRTASKAALLPPTSTGVTSSQVRPAKRRCASVFVFSAGEPFTRATPLPFRPASVFTLTSSATNCVMELPPIDISRMRASCGPQPFVPKTSTPSCAK